MNDSTRLLKIAAHEGDPDAQFKYSQYLHTTDGNLVESIHWLKKSASQNNVLAITNLGICYFYGDCLDQSYEKAFELFVRASPYDNNAKYYLGLCYLKGFGVLANTSKGFELLFETSRQSMPWADLAIAECYELGIGTAKDIFEAISWYAKAAKNNIEPAIDKFNELYYTNSFYNADGSQRLFWFELETLKIK